MLYSRTTNKETLAKVENVMLQLELSGELAEIQSRYISIN